MVNLEFTGTNQYDLRIYLHRSEAALQKHLREHDQKAALQVKYEKIEISLGLAKTQLRVCRIRICDLLQ